MKRHTRWGLVEQRSVDSALVTARWRSCSGLTTTAKSTGRSRSRRMGVALLVVDPAEPPSALGAASARSFGAVSRGRCCCSGAIVAGRGTCLRRPPSSPPRLRHRAPRPHLMSHRQAPKTAHARMQRAHARMQRAQAPHGMEMYDWVAAARLSAVATQRCIRPFRRAGVCAETCSSLTTRAIPPNRTLTVRHDVTTDWPAPLAGSH
jgi:hypothetical protein